MTSWQAAEERGELLLHSRDPPSSPPGFNPIGFNPFAIRRKGGACKIACHVVGCVCCLSPLLAVLSQVGMLMRCLRQSGRVPRGGEMTRSNSINTSEIPANVYLPALLGNQCL